MKKKFKLIPEMIPSSSFFTNLRSMLSEKDWDTVRKICYLEAKYVCEICGGRGKNHPVECHEVWKYNIETKVQKLKRLIALCPACHEVVHIGFAGVRGRTKHAIKHLMKVNDISKSQAKEIISEAWALWEDRNKIKWKLNIKRITKQLECMNSIKL